MATIPVFPIHQSRWTPSFHGVVPPPYPWASKFLSKQWVYTDGSDITGHPRLGAWLVHVPSNTTIYIDDAGTEETRTIMRAELVAIHTALTTLVTHERICIFSHSLSSLQAIRHHHTKPGTSGAKHYHHNTLLLGSITDLLETRRSAGLCTTFHKIKAHTNIRGDNSRTRSPSWLSRTSAHSLCHKRCEYISRRHHPALPTGHVQG